MALLKSCTFNFIASTVSLTKTLPSSQMLNILKMLVKSWRPDAGSVARRAWFAMQTGENRINRNRLTVLPWKNILRGNFGFSVTASAPAIEGFKRYFPNTLELVVYATPIIILVGVWLGTIGAVNKDRPIDHTTRVFAIMGYSLPTFWLGLLLLMIVYGYFGRCPPGVLSNEGKDVLFSPEFRRYTSLITIDAILNWNWKLFWDALYHLILPIFNMIILSSALILSLVRSSMLEAMGQDYIRTATAKGTDRKTVINVHARRNALIPVITISALCLPV